jgi:hypothetical protein
LRHIKLTYRIIVLILLLFAVKPTIKAQINKEKFKLEITKINFGVNAGPYRGRNPLTDGPFNQGISGFGQVYFPFQFSYGNSNTKVSDEYSEKTFLIRSSIIMHLVDNGSYAYGSGMQVSIRSIKNFYLEYQLGIVYLEANNDISPDLNDGMNLHNFISISKPLNQHFTTSLGFIHMSKGWYDSKTSNQDVITLGLKWSW